MSSSADSGSRTDSAARPSDEMMLDLRHVSHHYAEKLVLNDVSLVSREGDIHALLGPNGAGKTTLIRILAGLLLPTSGSVEIGGFRPISNTRVFRQRVGYVPSGDRSFYLRISALENLSFFARMHGMRRRDANARSREVLEAVGLADEARQRVGEYSHGMQKRLSFARALLMSPPVLLVDEATHDLDPDGSRRIRELTASAASRGALVVWATQRLDEIRGFAHWVTLLGEGQVRFSGTVDQLMAHATPRRFVLHVANGSSPSGSDSAVEEALRGAATVSRIGGDHYVVSLSEGVVLGDALDSLSAANLKVLSCRNEQSEIEEAFLLLAHARLT
jgi:ABC-2 type transport system ATP-binding protein